MRVLITGIGGFIGFNVAMKLVISYKDWEIVGLDKISYCSSQKSIDMLSEHSNFKFIKCDLVDLNALKKIYNLYNFDYVLHFAAYTHVDHSFGDSIIYTTNNVIGTHNLLEVMRANIEESENNESVNKMKKYIHVSTDEVYGTTTEYTDEKSILKPTNPYAATKAAAEMLVQSYIESYGLPAIITRGNNVYGPYQYPDKVIPRFLIRLMRDLKLEIQGDGSQIRSFLYVDDVANAFVKILSEGVIGEIYNIGTDEEKTILEVANESIDITGRDMTYIEHVTDRKFNDKRYFIDSSKLTELGWNPENTFEMGLKKTYDWYVEEGMTHWTESQLEAALKI